MLHMVVRMIENLTVAPKLFMFLFLPVVVTRYCNSVGLIADLVALVMNCRLSCWWFIVVVAADGEVTAGFCCHCSSYR